MEARLIIDPPQPGAWNMAVDEALLETASAEGGMCLRFYHWSRPTLSLGYFQELAQREKHLGSREADVVRRSTGGGAILHDGELTYSFTCVAGPRSSAISQHYYYAFHETAIELLAPYGASARLVTSDTAPQAPQPFLCFQRRATGDVVVGEHKILGSAQRRHQRGLLQHGSLLLATSPLAAELPGLESLIGMALDVHALIERWTRLLETRLNAEFRRRTLSECEQERARAIVRSKFGDKGWTARR